MQSKIARFSITRLKRARHLFHKPFLCNPLRQSFDAYRLGDQEHDSSFDILYKLEAILSGIRALRTNSWLAVTTRRIYGPDGKLKQHIADRTALYNCTLIGPDAIVQLAQQPDDAALLQKTLFPVRSEM